MALHTNWGPAARDEANETIFVRWAETIAYYMMFTGMQSITENNVSEFVLRWQLWDCTVSGETYKESDLLPIARVFIGTTANVAQKTMSGFLSGDIKRVAKDKRKA